MCYAMYVSHLTTIESVLGKGSVTLHNELTLETVTFTYNFGRHCRTIGCLSHSTYILLTQHLRVVHEIAVQV